MRPAQTAPQCRSHMLTPRRSAAISSRQSRSSGPRLVACRAVEQTSTDVAQASTSSSNATESSVAFLASELDGDPSRRITIRAQKHGTRRVVEGPRPLREYMTLPASQYSVLDANKVERLDAETFRCHVGAISFFNFRLEPVLTLRVQAHPEGCDITMLGCKMDGSAVVRAQNSKFASRMSNKVRWKQGEDGDKELVSDVVVETELQVPKWFVLPMGTIKSTGDAIMGKVLDAAVPKFLQQLDRDYQAWASGDNSRTPLGNGAL